MNLPPDRARLALALQYEQYRRDFQKFATDQLKIKGAAPGEILPLDLSVKPVQQMIWAKVKQQLKTQGYVRGRIMKGRQQGSSTCTQGIMYWQASMRSNFDSLLMAQNADTTGRIFQMARHYYDHVQPTFKPMIRYSSKAELSFENPDPRSRFDNPGLRSRMDFADASKKFPGTGQTRHGLHTSEAAKYPEESIHELAGSFIPMLHDLPGTFHLDESTAYVLGNWFRAGCEEARSGKSRYFWVFSPWYYDPEYQLPLAKGEEFVPDREERRIVKFAARGQKLDGVPPVDISNQQLKWRREKIREFELAGLVADGAELFSQEYPLDFESAWISFDAFVFNRAKLFKLQQHAPAPRLMRPSRAPGSAPMDSSADKFDLNSEYRAVWELPKQGRFYDLGVDVSAGIKGGDWSVIQVIDRFSNVQVAEIHLQADIVDLADEIFWWGACYNWGQVAIEFNAEGISVNQFLQRKNYPYLYFWRNRGGAFPKVTKITGWKTQRDSKRLLITLYQAKFNRDEMTINSRLLLHDMSNYVRWPSGEDWSYGASQGHDDRVMAFGIALIASDDEKQGLTQETNLSLRPKDLNEKFDISYCEPETKSDEQRIIRMYQRSLGQGRQDDY